MKRFFLSLALFFSSLVSADPFSQVVLTDDFCGASTSVGSIVSNLGWLNSSTNNARFIPVSPIDKDHPGVLVSSTIDGASNVLMLYPTAFLLGDGDLTINFVFKITTLSNSNNRYLMRIGLGDTTTLVDQSNGVYFEYSDNVNLGNWVCKTASSNNRTVLNTGVTVTTGWHNLQVYLDPLATSATFSLDGSAIGTLSTNIPIQAVSPIFYLQGITGVGPNNKNIYVDLFTLTQNLINSR